MTKLALAARVVDRAAVARHFRLEDHDDLYQLEEEKDPSATIPSVEV